MLTNLVWRQDRFHKN